MNFEQQLLSYYRGERLEAILLTVLGLVITGVAVVMWHHAGANALLKGLCYPITALAAFTVLTGGFGFYNNSQRLTRMPAQYARSQTDFVQAERNRFEGGKGVNTWWMPLKVLSAALVLAGIAVSFITRSDFANGVAIGLIFIGGMGFMIDGFANHRAKLYTAGGARPRSQMSRP